MIVLKKKLDLIEVMLLKVFNSCAYSNLVKIKMLPTKIARCSFYKLSYMHL